MAADWQNNPSRIAQGGLTLDCLPLNPLHKRLITSSESECLPWLSSCLIVMHTFKSQILRFLSVFILLPSGLLHDFDHSMTKLITGITTILTTKEPEWLGTSFSSGKAWVIINNIKYPKLIIKETNWMKRTRSNWDHSWYNYPSLCPEIYQWIPVHRFQSVVD